MRILLVHNILWAHYKASVFQALQQLADQRPDVTVHVLQIARNERSRATLSGPDAVDAPTYQYSYELLFDSFLEDIGLTARAKALYRRAKAFTPDVLMLTGYYDPAQLLLLLWAKQRGIRVVMQMESTAYDHRRVGWKEALKRRILDQFDGFFCFGNQSANYLIQSGVRPEKILLRRNAVDNNTIRRGYEAALPNRTREQQRLGLRATNFIFVGRLVGVKNLPALLTAFAQASQQTPMDWGLILLGDGPEEAMLRQQTTALSLTDRVQFLPGRAWYEVAPVLTLADVLVLTSLSETWGLVVNEALVCGLPVLVSDRCGCVPDLVQDGVNGLVFSPDVPGQLTDRLLQFMQDGVDRPAMQQAARQSVVAYSPERVAEDMLRGFLSLVQSKR